MVDSWYRMGQIVRIVDYRNDNSVIGTVKAIEKTEGDAWGQMAYTITCIGEDGYTYACRPSGIDRDKVCVLYIIKE